MKRTTLILVRKLRNGILLKVNRAFGIILERKKKEKGRTINQQSRDIRIDISHMLGKKPINQRRKKTKQAMIVKKIRRKSQKRYILHLKK